MVSIGFLGVNLLSARIDSSWSMSELFPRSYIPNFEKILEHRLLLFTAWHSSSDTLLWLNFDSKFFVLLAMIRSVWLRHLEIDTVSLNLSLESNRALLFLFSSESADFELRRKLLARGLLDLLLAVYFGRVTPLEGNLGTTVCCFLSKLVCFLYSTLNVWSLQFTYWMKVALWILERFFMILLSLQSRYERDLGFKFAIGCYEGMSLFGELFCTGWELPSLEDL